MGDKTRGFDKKKIKQIKELIIFAAIVVLVVVHSATIGNVLLLAVSIIMPFAIGAGIAFIINMPMRFVEKKLLGKWNGKGADKFKRPISLVSAIIFIVAVITLVIVTVVPQLVKAVSDIIELIPPSFEKFVNWLQHLFADNPQIMNYLEKIDVSSIDLKGMLSGVVDFASSQLGSVIVGAAGLISGIAGGVIDAIIAMIFALYVLSSKEKLVSQGERVARAFLQKKHYDFVVKTCRLLKKNFHNFLTGQCLEAVILGMLFFIVMTIIGLPYAALAGVLIGFTALIPVAGAFIGCVICAFLILMVSPVKMVIFLITFIVLQQLEGNLIYPRVVGGSVGLPAIWVLVAVSVGGSLMGVVGMLVFIPIFSTIYMLLRDAVNERNEKYEDKSEIHEVLEVIMENPESMNESVANNEISEINEENGRDKED
ncbi:MAG: AI-2E family transporter [Lachnospiraceae bacterium]|nr:AI-2E family transporter [Lachnospiraceae bacterium]